MAIKLLGSKFTKVSAFRDPEFSGTLNMNQNINIKKIDKYKSEFSKQESLKINYSYIIDYKELGKIEIEGILFIGGDNKLQKELLKNWTDKNYNTPEQVAIMNLIIQKASVKALVLEEELSLPVHFKLPSLQPKKE